jgi:hypothetical protein
MKSKQLVTATFILSLMVAAPSWAQGLEQRGGDAGTSKGQYGRMYDSRTVETLTGEVIQVGKFNTRGGNDGACFTFKGASETLEVILGPGWYVNDQYLKIQPKDELVVKGSRVMVKGKPAIIATVVKKGDKTLNLRDENGTPVWVPQSAFEVIS